jgi:hypothetical protein
MYIAVDVKYRYIAVDVKYRYIAVDVKYRYIAVDVKYRYIAVDVKYRYIAVDVKYPLFLSDFKATRNFSTHIQKFSFISNLMKVRRVGDELLPADRQTDRHDEANSLCSKFCECT